MLAYLGVILVPPGLFYFGLTTNQTIGTFLVCLALVACRLGRIYGADGSRDAPVLGDRAVLFVFGLVGLHMLIAAASQPISLPRAIGSMAPLGLLLLGGGTLASLLFAIPARTLHRGLRACFLLLCLLAILAVVGIVIPSPMDWRKPVFPFSEPSVFALAFIPLFMYVSVTSRGARRLVFVLLGLACTALIQNLTLMVGFAIVAVTMMRWQVVLAGSLLIGAVAAQLDLTYYLERLDFSGESTNLSNLVYLQGWQMVGESWERSSGFGIGFQQLGVFGTEVPAAQIIRAIREGEDSNLLDGGFVFAKLGSEFGIFAVVLVAAYLALAWKSLRALRKAARHRPHTGPLTILAHCAIVSFFVELFVRSAGYFTPAALIFLAALGALARERRNAAAFIVLPAASARSN